MQTEQQFTIEHRVKAVVAEQYGIETDNVLPEHHITNEYGGDSLDAVELIMAFEDEFNLEIPDQEADKIHTVQQAIDYVRVRV